MDGTVTCRRLENIIENNKEAGSSIAKLLRAFSNKVKKDELHFQIAQQKWVIRTFRRSPFHRNPFCRSNFAEAISPKPISPKQFHGNKTPHLG
ncbi:unnamed protein product [Rhizophagus irregularis]|uniref:Uncharacterized protein n=1 Tax=Rhizophagus irregularis TaxID=588596 RepID=A0A916A1A5_9GLOM|nr:unnamed protein product [Rhizophagus irregularis]CAB5395313.1 unnamed protein product [Rhizophagus irregularis]